jgi:hypothetical protein
MNSVSDYIFGNAFLFWNFNLPLQSFCVAGSGGDPEGRSATQEGKIETDLPELIQRRV